MSSHINEELLIEILKRIPVKLLIKFRCVSKSWYSLIANPSFISIHTNHTLNSTPAAAKSLLRHYSWTQKQEIYTIHCNPFVDNQQIEFPFKSYSQYYEIVGSCNGLICLSDTYRVCSHPIILWNPTIRKSLALPSPCITFDQIYMFVLGFGFDFKSNRYKVVRVVYQMSNNWRSRVEIMPKVEVYALGMDSWRSIKINAAPQYVISELSLQVFLNGAVHWIGYNPSTGSDDFRDLNIVMFDMIREVFDEMCLPGSVCGLSVLDLCIFASGKLLSLIQYNRHSGSQWIRYGSCSIWVMKEYGNVESWCKQFTVDLHAGVGKALGLRNNGDELLLATSNGELASYDSRNEQIILLEIKGIVNSFHMEAYIETLILLDCFNGSY